MKTALCPGSFDPVTNGHIDVIERAANIFDKVVVAVISNPEKEPYFSLSERVTMLRKALANNRRVTVVSFDGLLANFARRQKVNVIVRGLRAVSDFDYEFQMALNNRKLAPEIETIFLMTDSKYSYLSSSLVRQIARLGGSIQGLAPRVVAKMLKKRRQ
jgi:pantetheine-phosphate adenylyltransferase